MSSSDCDSLVPLALAAQTARMSRERFLRLVLIGEVNGRQINGRWYIERAEVERLTAQSHARAA